MKPPTAKDKLRGILRAVMLHGFWRLRWYHTVLIWLWLAITAWGASPYFMAYVIGLPEPGIAPRYSGTLRIEGELQRSKNGWIPPRYFIHTGKGDKEFFCGYRPYRIECSRLRDVMYRGNASDVYQVGYDSYWGVDFIKFPERFTKFDEDWLPTHVTSARLLHLGRHSTDLWMLCFGLVGYLVLVHLAYQAKSKNVGGSNLFFGFWGKREQKNESVDSPPR